MNEESKKGIGTWLFNPFHFIGGEKALLWGLGIILVTSLIGSFAKAHCDGVLDFHMGAPAPTWFFFVEGLVSWLSLALVLIPVGMILSSSKVRVVDVLGGQALARFPMLITVLFSILPGNLRYTVALTREIPKVLESENPSSMALLMPPGITIIDLITFAVTTLVCLVMLVWMVVLMYRAYATACNVRGAKGILSFIAALIGAEIISKIVIIKMFMAITQK